MGNAMDDSVEGSCLCGGVRFAIRLPSLWCVHCHCSMCRRASGSAFVTWVGVASAHFRVHDGATLSWHASSPGAMRGFCARCGSPMFFHSERWPGERHVTLANLLGPIDRAPEAHVFHDAHVDWVELADTLPRRPAAEA